jgi:hypothetical protein
MVLLGSGVRMGKSAVNSSLFTDGAGDEKSAGSEFLRRAFEIA